MDFAQKKLIFRAYRARFGGQPFDVHINGEEGVEAFHLMARALETGKPILMADKENVNPDTGFFKDLREKRCEP
ncbi:MAG: hypothetical protein JXQ99_25900 [Hyphomicrobiaceae bacterium]